jgi:hypothetical protein
MLSGFMPELKLGYNLIRTASSWRGGALAPSFVGRNCLPKKTFPGYPSAKRRRDRAIFQSQ